MLRPLLRAGTRGRDVLVLCGASDRLRTAEEAQIRERALDREAPDHRRARQTMTTSRARRRRWFVILTEAGVRVLDGDSVVIGDVGFAGVKGFCGGFGRGTLGPWGESAVKLIPEGGPRRGPSSSPRSRGSGPTSVALFHHSPIMETVIGEPGADLPVPGCSRLETRSSATRCRRVPWPHHRGTMTGRDARGIPSTTSPIRCSVASSGSELPLHIVELTPRPDAPRRVTSGQSAARTRPSLWTPLLRA